MRHYETIIIIDPDISPDAHRNLFEKAEGLIDSNQGQLVEFDKWGNKRLAYEIRKKQRGYYVRLDYCGHGNTVYALESAFRIDERIMKFMTILIESDADPKQLIAAAESRKQAAETPAEEAAEQPAGIEDTATDGEAATETDTLEEEAKEPADAEEDH